MSRPRPSGEVGGLARGMGGVQSQTWGGGCLGSLPGGVQAWAQRGVYSSMH